MNIIEIKNLNKHFGKGDNTVNALKNINLNIKKGDFVAIIGQSGSGKSTLMNMLGCLDTPTSGSYKLDSVETGEMTSDELSKMRGTKLGFIFQRYNLLGSLSVEENVALPAIYSGIPYKTRMALARKLLSALGLADKIKTKPNELSGGQQQRVSIARALMNGGEIILADEPTGALDSKNGEMVMKILQKLHQKGHTIILVTHDKNIAKFAGRVIELKDGVIIDDKRNSPLENTIIKQTIIKESNSLIFYKDQLVEAFNMSVQAIVAHKLRSILTMLGIIIGIASVVTIVALGEGTQEKILSDINSMGTNTINIFPGEGFGDMRSGRIKTLTIEDVDVLSQQGYLVNATPNTMANGVLVYRNVSVNAQLNGVNEQYFGIKGLKIDKGHLFNKRDVKNSSSVVVIDPNTRNNLFLNGENPIGKVIIFNKQPLEIIGVSKKQDTVFGHSDSLNLWSPYSTVMNKITGDYNISSITVKVRDDISSQVAEKNLTKLLSIKHGTMDFFTQNTDSIKRTIQSTTNSMTLLISCIALISLIVGGIGVMNIMLVSVTERTKEIGIRMAIGARQYNILVQFLIEAILICLMGGFLGISLSYLIGLIFNNLVTTFAISFSMTSIMLALGCSTLIGIIFGFMPANNASKLNPITALSGD